ncbi:PQQ-binding-like beta-propeller repeat protein [Peptococcaceae bacterium 1198_IL3148]
MQLIKSSLKALGISTMLIWGPWGVGPAQAADSPVTEVIPVAEEITVVETTEQSVTEAPPIGEPTEETTAETVEEPVAVPVVAPVVEERIEVLQSETTNHPRYVQRLENGNYLVCRVGEHNPGVFEISPEGEEVWSYPNVMANSAIRLTNGNTLIADSGTPGYPNPPRVVEVNKQGNIVWQYNLKSLAESPRYAQRLDNSHTLVTLPFEIRELNKGKAVVWRYGNGKPGPLGDLAQLSNPVQANRLANGNTLVVDEGINGGRVFEVTPEGEVAWDYRTGLQKPKSATRLDNDNTVIVDRQRDQLLVVDQQGKTLAIYSWAEAVKHLPVMNVWYGQYLPDDSLLLTMTLTNNASRVLELNFGDNIE